MKRLLLIGGGGHCVSCLDVIEATGEYEVVGILDRKDKVGRRVGGYSIVGCDSEFERWLDRIDEVLITVGMVGRSPVRQNLYDQMSELGAVFARVISPRAYVSSRATIGGGSIVMHDALVNAGASIGDNCILNTKSLIEHDSSVGDHCHIATRATLNGDVSIGDHVFIGSHSVIFQGCHVGEHSVIGGGQVVRSNLGAGFHPNGAKVL